MYAKSASFPRKNVFQHLPFLCMLVASMVRFTYFEYTIWSVADYLQGLQFWRAYIKYFRECFPTKYMRQNHQSLLPKLTEVKNCLTPYIDFAKRAKNLAAYNVLLPSSSRISFCSIFGGCICAQFLSLSSQQQ